MRTQPCNEQKRQGRLRKAEQFYSAANTVLELADLDEDIADAYVTLCVHSGIAAADVICCARLGKHAQGQDHNEAVDLLKSAAPDVAQYLDKLLGLKTKSGYSHVPASQTDLNKAVRAAESLIEEARPASATAG